MHCVTQQLLQVFLLNLGLMLIDICTAEFCSQKTVLILTATMFLGPESF